MRVARTIASALVALVLMLVGIVAVPTSAGAADERYPVPREGVWEVQGRGWGHGIGMSQWGAQGAARQGLSAGEILEFYYPGTTAGTVPDRVLRVAISALTPTETVTLWAPAGQSTITVTSADGSRQSLPAGQLTVTRDGDRYTVERRATPGGTVEQRLVATGPEVRVTAGHGVAVAKSAESGTGTLYRGTVRLAPSTSPRAFDVINDVPLEDYLRGVVPRESPASWHQEALKAQAVAARSYVLSEGRRGQYFDTCDTTQCQVYGGMATVDPRGAVVATKEHANTDAAIAATRGSVRMYQGQVAFTQFSSTNGGFSRAGSKPYLVAKADPYTGTAPGDNRTAWTDQLSVADVERHCPAGGRLTSMAIRRDGNGPLGGRISSITVECTSGTAQLTGTGTLAFGMLSHWWKPVAEPAERWSGGDRYETSADISSRTFQPGVPVAYVANGQVAADALSAAPIAGMEEAPLLLTWPGDIPPTVRAELHRLRPGKIVVLGGTAAVNAQVQSQLRQYAGTVERWAGADRYETSAIASRARFAAGTEVAYVTAGQAWADALSVAPVAGRGDSPLLLTTTWGIPPAVRAELQRLRPARIVVIGGPAVISAALEQELSSYAETERWSGTDRYETSAVVARRGHATAPALAFIASGAEFADALSAAPVAGMRGAPVLLTRPLALPTSVRAELARLSPQSVVVLGGQAAISEAVAIEVGR